MPSQSAQVAVKEREMRESRIASRVAALKPSGIRAFFDLVLGRPDILSLGVGEPDYPTPWGIREQGIYSLEKGHTSYTSNMGYQPFLNAISRWIKEELEVEYSPDSEILVTVGVSEALDLACRALLEEGDEALIPDPCFVSYPALVELAGAKPVLVATSEENGFIPTIEALEESCSERTRVILLNFPNNPTGAIIPRKEMERLAAWIQSKDLVLLSDEIYSPLTYDDSHTSFAALPGMKERTVLLHGLSKAWAMTGWRIGYAAGPPDIIAAMGKIHQYQIMCAPITGQMAGVEALEHGAEVCEQMRNDYSRRRQVIVDRLNDIGLSCPFPGGAFYVFPSIRETGLSSEQFALNLLEKEQVAVVPGTAFGEAGEGYIRCSYATSVETIEKAMDRMEHFVSSLR